MVIAVPTGIKIFNWLATMYGGKIRFATPMLFCIGILFQFLCAGLTGMMLGVAPFDWQLTRLLFRGGAFSLHARGRIRVRHFRGHSITGSRRSPARMLSEKLGKWHFWLFCHRLQLDLPSTAFSRVSRDAAAHLHLRSRAAAGSFGTWSRTIGAVFQAAGHSAASSGT